MASPLCCCCCKKLQKEKLLSEPVGYGLSHMNLCSSARLPEAKRNKKYLTYIYNQTPNPEGFPQPSVKGLARSAFLLIFALSWVQGGMNLEGTIYDSVAAKHFIKSVWRWWSQALHSLFSIWLYPPNSDINANRLGREWAGSDKYINASSAYNINAKLSEPL